jgi:GntR family transcriptional regulator
MRRSQVRVGARLVSADRLPASPAVARGLGLRPGEPVHAVVRVRTAHRAPLALERSWFPAALFPDLLDHRMSGSLYRLLDKHYGRAPSSADERLEAVAAEDADADLLGVAAGAPLMLIERSVYDASGTAVEFARDLFRPDRVRISLRTGIDSPAQARITRTS